MSASEQHDLAPGIAAEVRVPRKAARAARSRPDENFIPIWLAALVLVLLVAVMSVGGYVVRDIVSGNRRLASPQQLDVDKWAKAVRANPNDARTHLALGYALQTAGSYKKSLAQYDAALKIDPNNVAALYNRGVLYLKTGETKLGESSLQQVLSIDKTHALAAKALGDYYARTNQYWALLMAVVPAATAHPEMADLQALAGVAYEHLGNKQAAVDKYKLALKYSPDTPGAAEALKRLAVTVP